MLPLAAGSWLYRATHAMIYFILVRLRARGALRAKSIRHTQRVFGLLQNARVDEAYILKLLPVLPPGDSELYSHPSLDEFKHEFDGLGQPAGERAGEKAGHRIDSIPGFGCKAWFDVAQIFNLRYRGFEIRTVWLIRVLLAVMAACRMQFGDTADCKSALQYGAARQRRPTQEIYDKANFNSRCGAGFEAVGVVCSARGFMKSAK